MDRENIKKELYRLDNDIKVIDKQIEKLETQLSNFISERIDKESRNTRAPTKLLTELRSKIKGLQTQLHKLDRVKLKSEITKSKLEELCISRYLKGINK